MNPIDFDIASNEWRKNKVYLGKGYFKYKCSKHNCNNLLYCYTIQHKQFHIFATINDIQNKNNPKQFSYCEEHLLDEQNR